MLDENRLIVKAKRSDREAAGQLISRYFDEIYIFVYRQTFDKSDAMDITQDVFLRMLRSIGSYDSRRASFRTWLYRIAASVVTDAKRKSARQPQQTDIDELPIIDDTDFTAAFEDKDAVNAVLEKVSCEDEMTQQIFRMKIFSDCTLTQIAQALNISESSVKSRYYRLLHKLRERSDDNE